MARKQFSNEFKAKVALEALKGEKTIAQLSSEYGVHASQINTWKQQAREKLPDLFGRSSGLDEQRREAEQDRLYQQMGRLQVGGLAAKKVQSVGLDVRAKRALVEPDAKNPSLRRQCALLGLNRSTWYAPAPVGDERAENQRLMDRINAIYTDHPFYGSRKLTAALRREGYPVNRKRVRRLMRAMGLVSIAPKPDTSRPHPQQAVYPYLLRGVVIERPNQVWSTDITDLRIERGWAYLVALIDWHSRYVLAWRLSNTLDTMFCVEALTEALEQHGTPEIFNTDQGSQFTSAAFIEVLNHHHIRISMDGKGRALDNIFIERLWRSLKYEEVYSKHYQSLREAQTELSVYFRFYNTDRPHQSLDDRTPEQVYRNAQPPQLLGQQHRF